MKLTYSTISFTQLTLDQLYQLMRLRQEIFVVEQDCVYLDADGKDQKGYHVIGVDDQGEVQAYARLLPAGVSYDKYTSIGRVVSSSAARGKGVGIALMKKSVDETFRLWPNIPIKISAQAHLQRFYSKFDFVATGAEYLEDDIPHIAMIKSSG